VPANSGSDSKMECSATVSVIISCYNSERFITDAIESVLSQTYKNYEIIIVDDGSTDNTKSLIINYPQIKYIYQKNQGVSSARNSGLKASKGKYIIFLDYDDILLPERLQLGVEYLESNLDCAFVLGWFDYIDSNGLVYKSNCGHLDNVDYKTMLRGEALVSPSGAMFRKRHLLAVGGFNANTNAGDGEDYELYLKLSQKYPFYFHNVTVFQYRRHNNNISTKNGALKTMQALLNLLDCQSEYLKNEDEINSYKAGKKHWSELLGSQVVGELVLSLKRKEIKKGVEIFYFLIKECPSVTVNQIWKRVLKNIKPLFNKRSNIS